MKVCVLFVGVLRPTADQVIQNIQQTIAYFEQTYPMHSFTFKLCAWESEFQQSVSLFCETRSIQCCWLPRIPESDVPIELRMKPPNTNRYRMFASMQAALDQLPSTDFDCVIRTRTDIEIVSFELPESVLPNDYYTVLDVPGKAIGDNLAYGTLNTMKRIWSLENAFHKAFNNEQLLYQCAVRLGLQIKEFKFRYRLYQSSSDTFDGVPQWSKRNREWSFDGKEYVRGTTIIL